MGMPQASQMLDTTLKTAVHREAKRHSPRQLSFIYENENRKVSQQMTRGLRLRGNRISPSRVQARKEMRERGKNFVETFKPTAAPTDRLSKHRCIRVFQAKKVKYETTDAFCLFFT